MRRCLSSRRAESSVYRVGHRLSFRSPEKSTRTVIIGAGAIGLMCALEATRSLPQHRVQLVLGSPADQRESASWAAGAMLAGICEFEKHESAMFGPDADLVCTLAIQGQSLWEQQFETQTLADCRSARDTLVYLRNQHNTFEVANFRRVVSEATAQERAESVSRDEWVRMKLVGRPAEIVRVRGEGSIDAMLLERSLMQALETAGVEFVADSAEIIDCERRTILLRGGNRLGYDRVLVAAGSRSSDLLPDARLIPMFDGVGSAMTLPSTSSQAPKCGHGIPVVIRTVNRGGSNCGLHLVPRLDGGIYLGASNYVARGEPLLHRVESLAWLARALRDEFLGAAPAYAARCNLLIGRRPRTIDGRPSIGSLATLGAGEVFVASGTNRLGLTMAPLIASWFTSWCSGENPEGLPRTWSPTREPLEWGTVGEARTFFLESRVGSAIEHSGGPGGSVKRAYVELSERFEELCESINGPNTKDSDVIYCHPDVWGVLATTSPLVRSAHHN